MEVRGKGLSLILLLVLVLNVMVFVSLALEYTGATGFTRLQWFAIGTTGMALVLCLRAVKLSSELRTGLQRRETIMRLLWLD